MIKEFRDFAVKGNFLDMAVGIIIGVAFGSVVTSLVNDVIMPPIGFLLNKVDFSNLFISLSGGSYASLKLAKDAGASTLNYGLFINTVINFLIVAFVMFLIVRMVNRMKREEKPAAPAEPTTKDCPYCLSAVPVKATRCPHCTSELKPAK